MLSLMTARQEQQQDQKRCLQVFSLQTPTLSPNSTAACSDRAESDSDLELAQVPAMLSFVMVKQEQQQDQEQCLQVFSLQTPKVTPNSSRSSSFSDSTCKGASQQRCLHNFIHCSVSSALQRLLPENILAASRIASGDPQDWTKRTKAKRKRPRMLMLLCGLAAVLTVLLRHHVHSLGTASPDNVHGLLEDFPPAYWHLLMNTAQETYSQRTATGIMWHPLLGDWMPPPPHSNPPDSPDASPDPSDDASPDRPGGRPPPPRGPDGSPSPKRPDPDPLSVLPPDALHDAISEQRDPLLEKDGRDGSMLTQQKSTINYEEARAYLEDLVERGVSSYCCQRINKEATDQFEGDCLDKMPLNKLRELIDLEKLPVKKNIGSHKSRTKHDMVSDIRREREKLQRPPAAAAATADHQLPQRQPPCLPGQAIKG